MITKGIRGAITVDCNTDTDIRSAVIELLNAMILQNYINPSNISHVIFTLTDDLDAAFPAKFARLELDGWDQVAMMCFHELNVPNALEKCLRVLIVINCEESFEPKFVYLKGASKLR